MSSPYPVRQRVTEDDGWTQPIHRVSEDLGNELNALAERCANDPSKPEVSCRRVAAVQITSPIECDGDLSQNAPVRRAVLAWHETGRVELHASYHQSLKGSDPFDSTNPSSVYL